jgi:hypothetical protein
MKGVLLLSLNAGWLSQVYDTELEKAENFDGFQDFCHTFALSRGKEEDDDDEAGNICGEFKVRTRQYHKIYPLTTETTSIQIGREMFVIASNFF